MTNEVLKADIRQVGGGVAIVDLTGKIILGPGATALRKIADDLLAEGTRKIVLNLAGVNYVDSAGLGAIVLVYKGLVEKSGALRLIHVQPRIQELLRLTKLSGVFQELDSEQQAIASFS